MRKLQAQIIHKLHVNPAPDLRVEIEKRVEFLAACLRKSGARGYVLGISGGQDSTLAGKLAAMACQRVDASLLLLLQPYGRQRDIQDAYDAARWIGGAHREVDIKPAVDALVEALGPDGISDYHKGNIKARIRMVIQYALAGQHSMLVVGTDHAAEAVTGFFTKFGDGAADVVPLSGLTKGQGREMLKILGCPPHLYTKVPTADLLDTRPGQPDETELGIAYETIDDYLTGREIDPAIAEQLEQIYLKTEHKRRLPLTPFDDWF
jgi:NAD+ synthase